MAFIDANLSQTGQVIGGDLRRFSYPTIESLATISASGYFATTKLRVGDVIDAVITDSLDTASRTTALYTTLIVDSVT